MTVAAVIRRTSSSPEQKKNKPGVWCIVRFPSTGQRFIHIKAPGAEAGRPEAGLLYDPLPLKSAPASADIGKIRSRIIVHVSGSAGHSPPDTPRDSGRACFQTAAPRGDSAQINQQIKKCGGPHGSGLKLGPDLALVHEFAPKCDGPNEYQPYLGSMGQGIPEPPGGGPGAGAAPENPKNAP